MISLFDDRLGMFIHFVVCSTNRMRAGNWKTRQSRSRSTRQSRDVGDNVLYHDVGWEHPRIAPPGAFVQPSHEPCLCLSWENMRASSGLAVALEMPAGQIQMDVFSSRVMVTERQLGGGQPAPCCRWYLRRKPFGLKESAPHVAPSILYPLYFPVREEPGMDANESGVVVSWVSTSISVRD